MGNRQSNPTQQYRLYCKQHRLKPLKFQSKYLDYDRRWEVRVITAYGYYQTVQTTKQKGKDEISQYFLNMYVTNENTRKANNVIYHPFIGRKLRRHHIQGSGAIPSFSTYTDVATGQFVHNINAKDQIIS